jgi:hypothetical protein
VFASISSRAARHVLFCSVTVHPSGSPVVIGDGNGNITSYAVTASTATLAAGSPYTTSGAAPFSCTFSRTGAYVYTGGNSGLAIAGYSVNASNAVLTPLSGLPFSSGAGNPVGYALDNTGRLFTANAATNQVRAFTTPGGVPTAVTGTPFSAGGLTVGVSGALHPNGFYIVADRSARVGVYQITGSAASTTLAAVSGSPFLSGGSFKADPTVYRRSTGVWYIQQSSTNYTTFLSPSWGLSTDLPVAADYDADGKADPAIYHPSTGNWAVLHSSTNFTTSTAYQWGLSSDVTVPGDYDGDGRADPAVYRIATGTWFILQSSSNYTTFFSIQWGVVSDVTVPGDYDGDGKFDIAIYRPSTGVWWILKSSAGYTAFVSYQWGISTDTAVNQRS